MNEHDGSAGDVARLKRINALCDEFEQAWRQGQRPRIEDCLGSVNDPRECHELFEELLAIELHHRRARGEKPAPEEFAGRFPDRKESIVALFAGTDDGGQTATTVSTEASSPPRPATHDPPQRIGDYEILEPLGQGGRGVVYKARQLSADRIVALKLIRPDHLSHESGRQQRETVERFWAEARAAAQLDHDHIVTLYDVGQAEGRHYIAMQYVEGASLAELLRDGPLENRRAATYLEQVARAVHEAHGQGVIHRDLKPHNVLVAARRDRALVTDFGLAKLGENQALTATGEVFGSPPYMSPEQATDAGAVTSATDVYGLGATLYQVLGGRPPFQASTSMATLLQVVHEQPLPLRRLNPDVDRDLETICMKCLEKEPSRRYATAEALADDLARYLRGEPISARPLGPVARAMRWSRRNRLAAALAAAVLLTLVTGASVSLAYAVEARRQANRANENADEADRRAGEATTEKNRADQLLVQVQAKNDLARKSILNQLRLYLRPSRIAGEVAAAADAPAARAALARLGRAEPAIVNQQIASAVDALAKQIDTAGDSLADLPVERRAQHPLNRAALQLARASRDAWEAACNAGFGVRVRGGRGGPPVPPSFDSPGGRVKALEQELIVNPIYIEARELTAAIAQADDLTSAAPQRRRFWELYYGEWVFVDNPQIKAAIAEFGNELAGGSAGTDRGELRLKEIANHIEEITLLPTRG